MLVPSRTPKKTPIHSSNQPDFSDFHYTTHINLTVVICSKTYSVIPAVIRAEKDQDKLRQQISSNLEPQDVSR